MTLCKALEPNLSSLHLAFLVSLLSANVNSVHLDVGSHCKQIVENEWTKYDCLSYPEDLTLDTQSTAKNVRIGNANSLRVNLEFLPDLRVLEIRNVSIVHVSSGGNASLSRLIVSGSETIHADLQDVESLEFLQITDTELENITFPTNLRTVMLQNVGLESIPALPSASIEVLDVSRNPISESKILENMPKLTFLNLANTNFSELPTMNLPSLDKLNLNGAKIKQLSSGNFKLIPELQELYLSQMPELEQIEEDTFADLKRLNKLALSENKKLEFLPELHLPKSLKYLNLSGNLLRNIPKTIMSLDLEYFAADGNNLICDCRHFWLYHWNRDQLQANIQCGDGSNSGLKLSEALPQQNCSKVELQNSTAVLVTQIHKSAMLSCSFRGNPTPSVTWITPQNRIFKRIPDSSPEEDSNRIQVLPNGDLYIASVERSDIGRYTCTGSNPVSDFTTYVALKMNPSAIYDMKIISILVGLATCVGFLLVVVIVLLVKLTVERCGWRCCRKRESPQAKRVKTMLENLEQYRSQQLERLRDNYHQQVHRIKENCSQQAERIRDAYQHQAQNVRDLRSYGTHQFTSIRDQYNEQIKRVSDYSTDRLRRVRTNYVTQRERISRFSAQQLLRLRESAKYQQRTLNKIIENLPSLYLDNCRTGGPNPRTDSLYFDDDFTEVDMYIKSTISRISQEFDNFNREAIPLETILEEKTDQSQIATEEVVAKQPRASRQGSGTSIDLSKFLPTRLTNAANNARKNRKRKRPKTQKSVSVTVEQCEPEVHEALLPQEEVTVQSEVYTNVMPEKMGDTEETTEMTDTNDETVTEMSESDQKLTEISVDPTDSMV